MTGTHVSDSDGVEPCTVCGTRLGDPDRLRQCVDPIAPEEEDPAPATPAEPAQPVTPGGLYARELARRAPAGPAPRGGADRPPRGALSELFTGPELFAADYPPVTFVVPRLIPEGLTLLVGSPKIGKSWLTYGIALAAASGGVILGERLEQRPVLHLAMEDSRRRLHARARQLGYTEGLAAYNAAVQLVPGHTAAQTIEAWAAEVPDDGPPPLVVVDTLGRVKGARGPVESQYDHDYRVGAALKATADMRQGMALVVVHHDRKADSADFVDAVSGTNGLAGAADTIVTLRRERATPNGLLAVTSRDEVEGVYAAQFVDGVWSLTGGSWEAAAAAASTVVATIGKGDTARRVVDYIAESGGGAQPAQVAEALGISHDVARQTLSRLARDGRLDRADGYYTTKPPLGGAE
jgi:hypothetical protein